MGFRPQMFLLPKEKLRARQTRALQNVCSKYIGAVAFGGATSKPREEKKKVIYFAGFAFAGDICKH